MPSDVTIEWNGAELMTKARQATARGTLAIADAIGKRAAEIVVYRPDLPPPHLRDSIHVALVDTIGEVDATPENIVNSEFIAICEVGSWLPYACVIECGRHEPYMGPATSEIFSSGAWLELMKGAFVEVGL